MSIDDDAQGQEQSVHDNTRWRTFKFVSIFVLCVLLSLGSYRFVLNTHFNDWYLYNVANHTAWVLAKVGYSCELEMQQDTKNPAEVRALLDAAAHGKPTPTQDDIAKYSAAPLSAWERWSYRADVQRNNKFSGALGPRVYFVLKPGKPLRIKDLQVELQNLTVNQNAGGTPAQQENIERLKGEISALQNQKDTGTDADRGYSFPFIVVSECGAIEVMAIFLAAVLAFPASWWKRLVGILLGVPTMYLVNIFRLSCLAVIGAINRGGEWFNFSHHYVWQAIFIVFVVVVWLAWIEFLVNRETWLESYGKTLMAKQTRTFQIVLFSVKFLTAVVVLVVLWWEALPIYGTFLVQVTGGILKYAVGMPIQWGRIVPDGLLNTETQLSFGLPNHQPTLPIALLVTNIPPYIALVLATAGLRFGRRLRILAYGCGILVAFHIAYIVIMMRFQETLQHASEIPVAVIQFFLTLPFLLWIVFAYWEHIAAFYKKEDKKILDSGEKSDTATTPEPENQ